MRVDHPPTAARRLEARWVWVAVALFLLLAADLFTSLAAASAVGLEHEHNPAMAWLLAQPLAAVVAVHAGIGAAVAWLFAAAFDAVPALPARLRRPVVLGLEAFLGALVVVGLFAVANNVTVIAGGRGLV